MDMGWCIQDGNKGETMSDSDIDDPIDWEEIANDNDDGGFGPHIPPEVLSDLLEFIDNQDDGGPVQIVLVSVGSTPDGPIHHEMTKVDLEDLPGLVEIIGDRFGFLNDKSENDTE